MVEHGAPSPHDLALLTSVIGEVARFERLDGHDAQDFAQTVHLKFVRRNYDILQMFRGDSSLRTYLTAVVTRALLDWRNARYGKWRPSAAAVRLGEEALLLDTLINRDGYSEEAAIEAARSKTGSSRDALRTVAERLPRRTRLRMMCQDHLKRVAADTAPDPVEAQERHAQTRRMRRALARAFRELPCEEQKLLSLRYRHDFSVRQISQELRTDQKALYRRFDRVVSKLRHAIVAEVSN